MNVQQLSQECCSLLSSRQFPVLLFNASPLPVHQNIFSFVSSTSPLGKLTYTYCHCVKEKLKHTDVFWAQPWDHTRSSKSTVCVLFPLLPRSTEIHSRRISKWVVIQVLFRVLWSPKTVHLKAKYLSILMAQGSISGLNMLKRINETWHLFLNSPSLSYTKTCPPLFEIIYHVNHFFHLMHCFNVSLSSPVFKSSFYLQLSRMTKITVVS